MSARQAMRLFSLPHSRAFSGQTARFARPRASRRETAGGGRFVSLGIKRKLIDKISSLLYNIVPVEEYCSYCIYSTEVYRAGWPDAGTGYSTVLYCARPYYITVQYSTRVQYRYRGRAGYSTVPHL
jgi:hypothetical protein